MSRVRSIVAKLFGLFVDDGSFALAVLGWLAASWLVLPRLDFPNPWSPVVLFLGLAAILLESALRRAGKRP